MKAIKINNLVNSRFLLLSYLGVASLLADDLPVTGNLNVSGNTLLGTSSTSGAFEVRPGGLFISKNAYHSYSGPGLTTADFDWGTKIFWHPGLGAFRAGSIHTSGFWNATNMGPDSIATGVNSKATGSASVSMGWTTTASGSNSAAFNNYTTASGSNSTAIGDGVYAIGTRSLATGFYTTASGSGSIVGGMYSSSSGENSVALGVSTTASAPAALATGQYTKAQSLATTAIGMYNVGVGNSSAWVAANSIFEIGIGTSNTDRKNAMTVYKNGNVDVRGAITCSPGGDIPSFGE